jgi:hypothetical protein
VNSSLSSSIKPPTGKSGLLTRRGKKLVAIVPIEDLDLIEQLEEQEDIRDVQEIKARIERGEEETFPLKDVF